jgi:hypothetical protein
MDNLPKDIRLYIAKKFDMYARIKTGLIGKLLVPQAVRDNIEKAMYKRFEHRPSFTNCCVTLKISTGKYYTCFFNTTKQLSYWYFTDVSFMYLQQNPFPLDNTIFPTRKKIYEMHA